MCLCVIYGVKVSRFQRKQDGKEDENSKDGSKDKRGRKLIF